MVVRGIRQTTPAFGAPTYGVHTRPVFDNAAFDPELTKLMGEALDSATTHLPGPISLIVQEGMAGCIIEAARQGERDLDRLRAAGLSWANAGGD